MIDLQRKQCGNNIKNIFRLLSKCYLLVVFLFCVAAYSLFLFIVCQMFGGRQQLSRTGYLQKCRWNGQCCAGVSSDRVI